MKFLILCTGNTCRSPMGAAILTDLLQKKGLPHPQVESAGLQTVDGLPAAANAAAAMKEWGLDLSAHRSKEATEELLRSADVIFVMSARHAHAVAASYPTLWEKLHVLNVPDPFGKDLTAYRACRDALRQKLSAFVEKLFPAQQEK